MSNQYASIIIPMFNAEKTIGVCLESVFKLSYDAYEVIVVDNGSTDSSIKIATEYPVKLVSKLDGTISSVRNFGARQAKGEILAFVDSDCVIDTSWLAEGVAVLTDTLVGAAGSGYLTPPDFTWVEKAWLYESRHLPFEAAFLPGGNLMVKRSIFCAVNGFNEKIITGEDSDFCLRVIKAGSKVINSPAIRCVHLGNSKTIGMFFKKEFWYGANMIEEAVDYKADKVFIFTCMYIVSSIVLLVGLVGIFYGSYHALTVSVLCLMTITFLSSCYRLSRSKKYAYFLQLNLLYFIYYFARSCALLTSVFGPKRKTALKQVKTTSGMRNLK